jgi:3-oxoacyl-[acyl-carrier protein] reductase
MTAARIVLITGANRGIGRAIAIELAKRGDCELVLIYRGDEATAAETAQLIRRYRAAQTWLRCDIARESDLQALLERLTRERERLDVLVNNAGFTNDAAFAMQPLEDIRAVLRANLRGTMALTLQLIPLLLRSRAPTVINLSSQAAIVGKEGQAAYSASKGGMIGFAQLLASSFRDRGLIVNTVVPGLVRTDMVKGLAPEMYEHFLEGTPLRRMGEAGEIAAVVAFLATTECRYLNSTALKVDGGFHR